MVSKTIKHNIMLSHEQISCLDNMFIRLCIIYITATVAFIIEVYQLVQLGASYNYENNNSHNLPVLYQHV